MTPSPYHAEQNIFYDLLGQGYAGLNNFFLLGRNNFSVCAVEDKEGYLHASSSNCSHPSDHYLDNRPRKACCGPKNQRFLLSRGFRVNTLPLE